MVRRSGGTMVQSARRTLILAAAALLAGCGGNDAKPDGDAAAPAGNQPVQPAGTAPVAPPVDALEADPAVVAALRTEIAAAEQQAATLFDRAVAIDGIVSAGTAYNETHVPEHRCYVLGRLLGKAALVGHLRQRYDPESLPRDENFTHELLVMSISLENFSHTATTLLKKTRAERVLVWNLDCAGKLGIPAAFIDQAGTDTLFRVEGDGEMLKVLGDIEAGFADQIIAKVEANPSIKVVALGSGGGFVGEALRAGAYIRRKGLSTSLYANCYSACPLVFMAGTSREIWSPYPTLGFHQVYRAGGEPLPLDSPVYQDVAGYLTAMGVNPGYVLRAMWSAPPDGMADIHGADPALCANRVATWVQRFCAAEEF